MRCIVFLLIINLLVAAQSLNGFKGYFNIPSAEMLNDCEVLIGTNFQSKMVSNYGNNEYNLITGFITIHYLPNLELCFRINSLLNINREQYTFDRMLSLKYNILKESDYLPMLSVGFHNPFSTGGLLEGSSNFNSSYIVGTKSFSGPIINSLVQITMGYGGKLVIASNYQYIGLFYGILFSKYFGLKRNTSVNFFIENDTEKFNTAIELKLLDYFSFLGGFIDMKYLSGGLSVKLKL